MLCHLPSKAKELSGNNLNVSSCCGYSFRMEDATILEAVRAKYDLLRPVMNERMRRQWAACEALSLKLIFDTTK
jgi:hypothetical protein